MCRIGIMLLFLFFPLFAYGHPHVFVDYMITVVFDENGLAGFEHVWYFDDMFGSAIIMDYDTDNSGSFSEDEILSIKNNAFSNLKDYEYFNHIEVEGESFSVQYVTDFSASVQSGQLVYSYFTPCHVTAIATPKTVSIGIYDASYYVDFAFLGVSESGGAQLDYDVSVDIDTQDTQAYGSFFPRKTVVTFQEG